jgi:nicotinate (nicotinamide) nucleotide adenylyltransferase
LSPASSAIPLMSKPELQDPYHPRTRQCLHEAVRALPREGPTVIEIVKRAERGIQDKKKGSLGVLPASFNPPTSAHQALIKEAGDTVAFDEVLLIVDQQAMDKERIGAPPEDRLLMLLALFGDDARISVGIANRGRFLDKVEAMRKVYPGADAQIYFIVGHDTIVRVLDPKYYEDRDKALRSLFAQARFLVANREGCDERDLKELFGLQENRPFAAQVQPLTLSPALTRISSTLVRRHLAEGKSVAGLVPPQLEEFLRKHGFYSRQGG